MGKILCGNPGRVRWPQLPLPGAPMVALPRSRSPVPSPTQPFWVRHCRICWSSAGGDGVPVIGREWRQVRPVITPPPLCPRRRSNSDHAGKSTYSGEIESLDRDPGIATLDSHPRNAISRRLTSLDVRLKISIRLIITIRELSLHHICIN